MGTVLNQVHTGLFGNFLQGAICPEWGVSITGISTIEEGKIPLKGSKEYQTKNLVQARIEMDELNCLWDRPKHTKSKIDLVFHEKALFRWPKEKLVKESRTIEPILDITIINPTDSPITLNRVGILLKDFWQKLKGISRPR